VAFGKLPYPLTGEIGNACVIHNNVVAQVSRDHVTLKLILVVNNMERPKLN